MAFVTRLVWLPVPDDGIPHWGSITYFRRSDSYVERPEPTMNGAVNGCNATRKSALMTMAFVVGDHAPNTTFEILCRGSAPKRLYILFATTRF